MNIFPASEVFKIIENPRGDIQNKNVKAYLNVNKSTGKTAAAFVAVRDKECYICNSKIVLFDHSLKRFIAENEQYITFDHILPKSMKGSDAMINGKAACYTCNQKRGNAVKFETNKGDVIVEVQRFISTKHLKHLVNTNLWEKNACSYLYNFFHEALQEKFPTGFINTDDYKNTAEWIEHEVGVVLPAKLVRGSINNKIGILKYV